MSEATPYIAIMFSGLTLLIMVAEKLFGGGNALANKFHALERDTSNIISAVRRELEMQVSEYEKLSSIGFDATRSSITEIRIGLLELRAHTAESLHLYIRKDDYHAGISDIKKDVQDGFKHVDVRLGHLQDLVLYFNPEANNKV